ncbi:MAG TPA: FIST N-terminal domain-containing protein [Acidimicrobiales bacterium]|nr:FIST N-terminal domain-containing protein [Acidimicrobiales bacterium]
MSYAAAISRHPASADATAEVVGQVLDAGGHGADLAVLFCSGEHVDAFADVVGTVQALAGPKRLVGITAGGVVGRTEEVENEPALSLWTAHLGYVPEPVRLTAASTTAGIALQGLPQGTGHQTALLLADPFSLPVPDLLDVVAVADNPLPVIGGLASAGMAPGQNRLVLDGEIFTEGAVGVLLDGVETVVSQGCRPIGSPMIVTSADGNLVVELAGQSAIEQLEQLLGKLTPEDRELLASGGLHLGVVADEHQLAFQRGDFLVRNVVGADRERGALAVGATLEIGTTVQFHLRDAASADEDLRALLAGHDADAALLFTCNGRGRRLFGTPDHDAQLVAEHTSTRAVAGMFCAGEIGPIGGRSFLHSFTASVLLFPTA